MISIWHKRVFINILDYFNGINYTNNNTFILFYLEINSLLLVVFPSNLFYIAYTHP